MVEVKKVEGKKALEEFIRFPWRIYRHRDSFYENWPPPLLVSERESLDRQKNPFFKHAQMENYLAYRGGETVGRVSAIVDDNYVEFQKDKAGFVGFFECINDTEVAEKLFKTAEEWCAEQGMERIIGPMNPSTNHVLGVLLDSFDEPPMVQMNYNPPYYPALYDANGYGKERDLLCYRMTKDTVKISEKIERVMNLTVKRNNLTVRPINMKKFDEEVDRIRELYNSAWEKNWGFVPWTEEEFDHMAEELKLVANPALVLLVFAEERLIGVSIPLPNINEILLRMNGRLFPFGIFRLLFGKNKVRYLRIAIMGVHPDFHNKGVDAIFTYETYKRGVALGYYGAEFSWILEDNYPLRNMLESWGTEMYRKYRVYQKKLF